MTNVLTVAIREFRQITAMRSFWLTLLILPIALAVGPLASRYMREDSASRIMIIDRTDGGVARALNERFAADADRAMLHKLSRYVRRHHLENADPGAPWAQHDRLYADADVAQFRAAGGIDSALARIARVKDRSVPDFDRPNPPVEVVTPPATLMSASDAEIDAQVQAMLKPTDKQDKPVDNVLLVPKDFGASPAVQLWSRSDAVSQTLLASLQEILQRQLRARYLEHAGVATNVAATAGLIAPAVSISTPPPGGGAKEAMLVRSILPLAASYLLLMSLMLSGSWMLQGTVEERSNKLLESVLACVSPEQLMQGKLFGTVAVGLSMIAVWIACGAVAAYATQGAIADLIRPALDPLTSPVTIAAMIYFFVVGYISISAIFLAIGAVSESMREAQGYLMPVLLAILLPITFLIQSIVMGRSGPLVEVLTWLPLWTPFAVLARLGTGIPAWEVAATAVVLAAFTIAELILLGKLFRASLLAQGQERKFGNLWSQIRRGDEDMAEPAVET